MLTKVHLEKGPKNAVCVVIGDAVVSFRFCLAELFVTATIMLTRLYCNWYVIDMGHKVEARYDV